MFPVIPHAKSWPDNFHQENYPWESFPNQKFGIVRSKLSGNHVKQRQSDKTTIRNLLFDFTSWQNISYATCIGACVRCCRHAILSPLTNIFFLFFLNVGLLLWCFQEQLPESKHFLHSSKKTMCSKLFTVFC